MVLVTDCHNLQYEFPYIHVVPFTLFPSFQSMEEELHGWGELLEGVIIVTKITKIKLNRGAYRGTEDGFDPSLCHFLYRRPHYGLYNQDNIEVGGCHYQVLSPWFT